MRVEKGMYVRTNDGIHNVLNVYIDNVNHKMDRFEDENCNMHFFDEIVGEPIFNCIDLIQVGDYVNGEKVIRIFNPNFLSIRELPYVITVNNKYEEHEIESIVTKEQFEERLVR